MSVDITSQDHDFDQGRPEEHAFGQPTRCVIPLFRVPRPRTWQWCSISSPALGAGPGYVEQKPLLSASSNALSSSSDSPTNLVGRANTTAPSCSVLIPFSPSRVFLSFTDSSSGTHSQHQLWRRKPGGGVGYFEDDRKYYGEDVE